MNAYIKNSEESQINKLLVHHKVLEKEKQRKSQ
jgi:hypothetical protein